MSPTGHQGPETDCKKVLESKQEQDSEPNPNNTCAPGVGITLDEEEDEGIDRCVTPEENLILLLTLNRDVTPTIKRLNVSEKQRKHLDLQERLLRAGASYQPQPQTSVPKKKKDKKKHLLESRDPQTTSGSK